MNQLDKRTITKLALVPKFQQTRNDPTDPYNRVGVNFAKPGKSHFIASLRKLAVIHRDMK